MSHTTLLVMVPAPRADLVNDILAAGAVPVLDLAVHDAPATVPAGAWTRVGHTSEAPPCAGVIAAAGPALAGVPCWWETPRAEAPPAGYAGVLLRGSGSGGVTGDLDVCALAAALPAGVARLLDWPHAPETPVPAGAAVLLSDVCAAGWLGPRLRARLARLSHADLVRVAGVNVVASPAAPALKRLAQGEPLAQVARGWFTADDAFAHAWPGGAGLLHAESLLATHGSLAGIARAYRAGADAPEARGALRGAAAPRPMNTEPIPTDAGADPHEPIAIIGLGCRLPRAIRSAQALWDALLAGFDAIGPVPPTRWDPAIYADPEHPDKSYTSIGAFVEDDGFNPRRFRIPPSTMGAIDPVQRWALDAAADALEDAGLQALPGASGRPFDRERTAVILGNSMGGENGDHWNTRVALAGLSDLMRKVPRFAELPVDTRVALLDEWEAAVRATIPPITEDSMPGELSNVLAGRVANALDLGGPNFTTDAACASSMAAISAAVKGLRDHEFDLALTGGSDRTMGAATYVKFCRIGALSPDGSRPFDAGANGFVMGEGAGVLALKRLSDAERDGDRIYAVIRGVGASSDGKGKGITAPNPAGQARALRRAYESAGVDPVDVDLFECHGTSTVVGDKVEATALADLIGEGRRAGRGAARIGSIKSNIGHLKSAAGAASALKAALSLHHGVLPPSIHLTTPRADLGLERAPLQVQVRPEPWASPMGRTGSRFAGVSSFGFGGTNFHLVLESWTPGMSRRRPVAATSTPLPAPAPLAAAAPPAGTPTPLAATPSTPPWNAALEAARETMMQTILSMSPTPSAPAEASPTAVTVPEGLWALSADTPAQLAARCRARLRGVVTPYDAAAPLRVAAAAIDESEQRDQLERCVAALEKGRGYEMLRQRGIHLEDEPCDGGLAFVFTGQGSQYVGMGAQLAERFPVVAATFAEADEVMTPLLGRTLTSLVKVDPSLEPAAQEDRLRQTEISQPATLTVDVAILRLLASYGVRPSVVAGHSLGEYAAAVAAGMLPFRDALLAVSARGREMANVQIEDKGKMAGIATGADVVAEVLATIPGYVVAANKNCPTQTVIAGESTAVDAASEAFRARGVQVFPLPVSHAFHSRIVAPATEPLRRVLQGLAVSAPRRRITTNVDASDYPTGSDAPARIVDILARQVASPVEWTAQLERMYESGARVFVECGPKRALTGFSAAVFKGRPHRALATNLPKRGETMAFLDALAGLFAMGFPVTALPAVTADLFGADAPRRATTEAQASRTVARARERAALPEATVARLVALDEVLGTSDPADLALLVEDLTTDPEARARIAARLAEAGPSAAPARAAAVPVGGIDPAALAAAMLPALEGFLRAAAESVLAQAGAPVGNTPAPHVTAVPTQVAAIARTPVAPIAASVPATLAADPPAMTADVHHGPKPAFPPTAEPHDVRVVCSGASVGLPGGEAVFAPDNITRILRGENRIVRVGEAMEQGQLARNIVRVTKDAQTGEGGFVRVDSREGVMKLAGRKTAFDPNEWAIDKDLLKALDITTQLATAAGYEALRDAGVPLVRTFRKTTTGRTVHTGWALPESWRDDTAVVLASAFPGYDNLVKKLLTNGADADGNFDRRFLFQILNMGHAQFAQLIGARGPNTSINAACASTTQAIMLAEDWIRLGRARRVIVLGADDITSDDLFPWLGTGFLAAGAAATDENVEDAALPFDRRRHGMIPGMGAVAMLLERDEDVRARGMNPIAELLGAHAANSAYHGTRLDSEHISRDLTGFVGRVCERAGVSRSDFAGRAMFMSHETYTPARGGSAAAEMASLPAAFGPEARRIVIANTKGFTGHAMGAGIEDAVAVKALQYGEVPPIANLKEPDPDLGELDLSKGGPRDVTFALRLAAGFGSQLAFAAWRKIAHGDDRVTDTAAYLAWIAREGGGPGRLLVEHRQLRWELGEANPSAEHVGLRQPALARAAASAPATVAAPSAPATPAPAPTPARGSVDALAVLLEVIAAKTGYAVAELDPGYALEADLGVDTVKQAEIVGEVRERFALPRDDAFRLSDYPTIAALAGWLQGVVDGGGSPPPDAGAAAPAPAAAEATPPARGSVDALAVLLEVIAAKTGYAVAELDPAFALEADLGVDTVKQAEIVGEVRERFALPRDDAFRLSDYPTIAALAGWLQGVVDGGGSPPPDAGAAAHATVAPEAAATPTPVTPAPAVVAPAPSPGSVDALAVLLEVIAAKTGYAIEELDPAFALEADLGVDTVKQAEIVGEVRERFALPRDDAFRLSDYPTIAALAGWLQGVVDGGGSPPPDAGAAAHATVAPEAAAPATVAPPAIDTRAAAVEEALSYVRNLPRVTPTPAERPPLVAAGALLPAGFRARSVQPMATVPVASPGIAGVRVRVLGDTPLATALRAHVELIGGVLADGATDVVIETGLALPALLDAAKALDANPPALWVCAVEPASDLRTARDGGARAGFAKALGREWAGCQARVVDLAPLAPTDAADLLLRELAEGDRAMEVRLGTDSREVLVPATVAWPAAGAPCARTKDGPVVLLTGGTRGITARVAQVLAEAGPCTLVLVGRTGPGLGPLDEAAAKHQARARIEASGERATPRRIEEALAPLRTAEEVRRNVAALRTLGATVEVRTLDLADPAAVKALVNDVLRTHGRLDVCVHGAGVEESRKLADKDERALRRVFDGKAVGGLALVEALPETTLLLSMGSIAGRMGNAGQVDYAAANEAMARVCQQRPRSLHVSWTAWGDVGMAVRGGMEALLTSRGVELLPAEAGSVLCRDLLAALEAGTVGGELLVAGAVGDFTFPPQHPLLDSVTYEGDTVVAVRDLSVESDAWILDHAIDAVPVLPGVVGLELMVAAARIAHPAGRYVGVEDARFESPVKLHGPEPVRLEVRATAGEDGAVHCTLSSRRKAKTGRDLHTTHFSVTVQLEAMPLLHRASMLALPSENIPAREIYRRFFHGPGFQVIEGVDALAQSGMMAHGRVEHTGIAEGLLTDPLVLEAAFQAAGLHRMVVDGVLALPAAIDAVERVRPVRDGEPLELSVTRRGSAQDPVYDVDVYGEDGRILTMRGFRMAERGPLPPGDRFPEPEGGWLAMAGATEAEARAELPPGDVVRMTARGTARRHADRLAGQLAARRAVSALAPGATFHVEREEGGAPFVQGVQDISVSITHADGRALALAVRGARAGIDAEVIAHRGTGFADTWFTDEERALGEDPATLTRAWAVKEAVLKALGTGMRVHPRDVVVRALREGCAEVRLDGEAATRHAALGGGVLRVRVTTTDALHVVATAILAA